MCMCLPLIVLHPCWSVLSVGLKEFALLHDNSLVEYVSMTLTFDLWPQKLNVSSSFHCPPSEYEEFHIAFQRNVAECISMTLTVWQSWGVFLSLPSICVWRMKFLGWKFCFYFSTKCGRTDGRTDGHTEGETDKVISIEFLHLRLRCPKIFATYFFFLHFWCPLPLGAMLIKYVGDVVLWGCYFVTIVCSV